MALSDRAASLVTRMTAKAKFGIKTGATIQLLPEDPEFNPDDGGVEADFGDPVDIQGIDTRYNLQELKDNTILQDDVKFLMDITSGVEPTVGSLVTFNGQTYRVMSVLKISVQGQACGYNMQLRI